MISKSYSIILMVQIFLLLILLHFLLYYQQNLICTWLMKSFQQSRLHYQLFKNIKNILAAAVRFALLALLTVISPATRIYASEQLQRYDSIDFVKSLIDLWCKYLPFDSVSITYHFLVANFENSFSEVFNRFKIFCVSIYIWCSQSFVKIQK